MHILKRIAFTIIATVWATSLVSCFGGHGPLEPDALQARGLKPGEGYIVAVFDQTVVNGGTGRLSVVARANSSVGITGPEGPGSVGLSPRTAKTAPVTSEGPSGNVVAVPVPAGDYAITSWYLYAPSATGDITSTNRLPFKAPFQVKPGEATYVGRLNAITREGRNLLGLPIFAGGMIVASDEFAKDQPRIARTYPSIKAATIRPSNVPAEYQKEMQRIATTPDDRNILQKLIRIR